MTLTPTYNDKKSPPITHPAVRDFPSGERPRERLAQYGASHLSNSELLAILLRTGLEGENVLIMASRLLAEFGGLSGLSRITFDEMCETSSLINPLSRAAVSATSNDSTSVRNSGLVNGVGVGIAVEASESVSSSPPPRIEKITHIKTTRATSPDAAKMA